MISYEDQALIITSDERIADELSSLLLESEIKRKTKALDDWQDLIEKAGLSKLTAQKIDRAVEKTIRRPK